MLAAKPAFLTSSLRPSAWPSSFGLRLVSYSRQPLLRASSLLAPISASRLVRTSASRASCLECHGSVDVASHFLQKRTFFSPSTLTPTRVGASHFGQTTWHRRQRDAARPSRGCHPRGWPGRGPCLMCRFTSAQALDADAARVAVDREDLAALAGLAVLALGARHHLTGSPTFSFCMALSRCRLAALEHFRARAR